MIFTINPENNITAFASVKDVESNESTQQFKTLKELNKLANDWPTERLNRDLEQLCWGSTGKEVPKPGDCHQPDLDSYPGTGRYSCATGSRQSAGEASSE